MIYRAVFKLPLNDADAVALIDRVREIAHPKLAVEIEAKDRRELARIAYELEENARGWECDYARPFGDASRYQAVRTRSA